MTHPTPETLRKLVERTREAATQPSLLPGVPDSVSSLLTELADALEPLLDASERVGGEGEFLGLRPCPFCGGHAEIIEAEEAGDAAYAVQCQTRGCEASSLVAFAIKDSVEALLVEKWNRRSQPQPPGAPGWRPIESAPRDGTPVDLWSAERGERIADAWWSGTAKLRKNEDHRWHAPNQDYDGESGWIGNGLRITHWMELPEPPR